MASIQVLELHPVEAQIEELSYDMTDSIRGGSLLGAYDCVFDGVQKIFRELQDGLSGEEALGIWIETVTCALRELYT